MEEEITPAYGLDVPKLRRDAYGASRLIVELPGRRVSIEKPSNYDFDKLQTEAGDIRTSRPIAVQIGGMYFKNQYSPCVTN